MPVPSIAEMLKYADLQMAAEALYKLNAKTDPNQDPGSLSSNIGHFQGAITLESNILTDGNLHASRFTPTEAAKFVKDWVVVDHISNTATGFSGTLFQNKDTKEYVISFRSTEFIDDVVRDCLATNAMEIKSGGWALGQITDMEAWYKSLKTLLPADAHYSVTGYSLGGHLATAFNLLRREDGTLGNVDNVVTFNGAGVGQITNTSSKLGDVLADFNNLREHPESISLRFADSGLSELYNTLRQRLANDHTPTAADFALLDQYTSDAFTTEYQQQQFATQKNYLKQAMERIVTIRGEIQRLTTVTDTTDGQPANIPDRSIAQDNFEYQMAYLFASENTQAKSLVGGGINTIFGKSYASPGLGNQYDVVGRETSTTQMAMVADSQWHYGTNVDLFIEDQPLRRGTVVGESWDLLMKKDSLLPISNYTQNDFGDTHSLVLLVDSLNIQNLLKSLSPSVTDATLNSLLKAASNLYAQSVSGQQGKAEGNVLENILDGLSQILMGIDPKLRDGKAENGKSLDTGNTWADKTLRANFYTQLDALQKVVNSESFKNLIGKFTLGIPREDLATAARSDFASLMTLVSLSPVSISAIKGQEGTVSDALGQVAELKARYDLWKADQSTVSVAKNYTEQYLTDRAKFLTGIADANTNNLGDGKNLRTSINLPFGTIDDVASGITLHQGLTPLQSVDVLIDNNLSGAVCRFGGEGNDTLRGGKLADHLYGGNGIDSLNGGAGDDYLEGGQGDDTLEGGKGNDTLLGGAGNDTYNFNSGDGWDWIEDSDGTINYKIGDQLIQLKGGSAVGDSGMVWQQKDSAGKVQFTYILTDWTEGSQTFKRLSIQGDDGGVWIKNWKSGDLGITLPGAPEPVAPPTVTTPTTVVGGATASYLSDMGSYSNFTDPNLAPTPYPNMQAGAGNAYIDGNYANNIKGGAGSAWIVGRAPDNTSSTGSQIIQGGQGDTFISTGAAEGIFIGGGSNTLIDARFYRSFNYDYAWDAIGSAFALNFGWQAISDVRIHVAYELGRFEPGQIPDTSGLEWLGYVDTAGLTSADGNQIYVAQPDFGTSVIAGQDGTGRSYLFDPVNWTLSINGGTPSSLYEWVVPIIAPKKQTLIGGQGDSVLIANDAGNILVGGRGINVMIGGKGNDSITAGNKNDHIDGGAGDDVITGGAGDSHITGGLGNNTIEGGSGNESIYAGINSADWDSDGTDTVNYVKGNDGNDIIHGSGGVDTLLGGLGNDDIWGANSNDVLDGGAGNDYLDGGNGDDQIDGGIGNDLLFGGAGKDYLQGGAGDDEIQGGAENDTLAGGSGSNRLFGGSGDDRYVIDGGSQNFISDEQGNDTLVFGAGIDLASVVSTKSDGGSQLVIDYGTGKTIIDNGLNGSIERFQTANGSTMTLRAFLNATLKTPVTNSGNTNGVPVSVYGGGAADHLIAGAGDRLIGGQGNDTLIVLGADATLDFQQGDGQDSVSGTSGAKHFSFVEDAGISVSSARLAKAAPGSRDLLLTYGESGDSISIEDSAFSINQTYSFTDGTVLSQQQLLEQSGLGLDWLGSSLDEIVSGTSNDDRLLGDAGDDVLNGLDGNDWLEGGDGRDTLSGENGDDILLGGRGDDKLFGGSGNDTLIGGAGINQLNGGAGHDVYVLERGTYNEIVDQELTGNETIRLPDSMRLADFYATRLNNDLIIQSLSGDTASKIVGYFDAAADGKSWFVSSDQDAARSLHDWVVEQIGASSDPALSGSESQRAGFEAALRIDLGQQGALGKTIGSLTDFSSPSMSMYFDQKLGRYLPFEYSFGGVATTSISMTQGLLVLDSSENDSVVLNQTTKTVTVRTPIYETWTSPGLSYVITPPTWSSGIGYPHGATLTDLQNGSYRVDEPNYWHTVVVGESVSYRDILVDTDLVTRTFTMTNVQGSEGNDTIMMGWQQGPNVFRGTVVAGDGNDRVDLGTTSKYNDDWFSGGPDWIRAESYGLGAYIDGGNGSDTLIGTDGNDVLVAGQGNDFLDGGRGEDTYHVSLESGAQDVIYDSGSPGGSASTGWVYGGQFPLDVLVFDAGVTVQNLSWRLIENSIYDGHHALEIFGGKGKIIVVFDDATNPAETESAIGVERFQFADGTVLSRTEFMAQVAEIAAPEAHGNLSDLSVTENATLSYLIPDGVFSAVTGGDYLSYQVQLTNGDPLPDWLTFDPVTRTLSGAPGIGNLADMALQVRAVNAAGDTAAIDFILTVTAAPGQNLIGTRGADTLVGMSGDDTINGGAGADIMQGGLGNDTYWVDRATDQVIEAEDAGTDTVIASVTYTLPDNVENLTLSGSANIKGYGNALDNVLIGNVGDNRLFGEDGNDSLYGSTGADQLSGGNGDDLLFGEAGDDELKGGGGNDRMDGGDGNDLIYGANGDDIATGSSGNDYLLGGNGQDTLDGGLGNDILDGGNSADSLTDLNGNNVLLGGANRDTLTSGDGNDLLVGGSGNDIIVGQGGDDVILFNQGDGYDKVTLAAGTSATVSLGGGIAYSDLTLKKSGSDLILGTGNSEGIVFKAWYSSAQTKNVQNLQVIAEAMAAFDANGASPLLTNKVQEFDFKAVVDAFDQARSATTGLSTWAISDALTQFHISGSDSLALGGDLAYQYGKNGTLAGINLSAAQSVIDDPSFGVQAQMLKPLSGLQGATVTL